MCIIFSEKPIEDAGCRILPEHKHHFTRIHGETSQGIVMQ